jgi:hypothetical protein
VVFGQQASDQGYQLTLTVSISVDVPLGGQQRPVTCEQLHIPE